MPNVYFKRGTQSELNRIQKGNYEPGAFYLTSDTNRLYFAQANDNLAELNQFIHIYDGNELPVSTTAEPLTDGDFYYWQPKNILMVYKNGNWIQINPDTRLAASQQAVEVTGATNGATITTTVSEDASKGVNTARSVVGDFTITGGDNVTVSVSGNTITIQSENDNTNTEYELKTAANANNAQLVLSEKGENPVTNTITMTGGNGLKVSSNANNQITVTPVAELITEVANEFDSNGNLTTTVTYGNGFEETSSPIIPTVKYGIANDKLETAVFEQDTTGNPTATLNIYTKQEIDNKFEQEKELLNAMTFKGTISSNTISLMNSSDRSVGDVFLASDTFSYGSPAVTVYAGDLIVAEGTDDDIHWTRIESGNDQIVTVNGNAAGNSVTFNDTISNNAIGSIVIDNNNISNDGAGQVSISATVNGTNDRNIEYNITHLAPDASRINAQVFSEPSAANNEIQSAATAGANSTLDIPTIKSIKVDSLGHIASIETAKFRVIDTWPTLSAVDGSATATNNVGYYSFGLGYTGDSSTQKTWSLGLTSDNLTITAQNDDQLKVNLEWGSFT